MAVNKLFPLFLALTVFAASPDSARAEGRFPGFIRDAEIEATIRSYATPLFTAAGLDASAVQVYIVNDETLNAFVAGGMNLFLNTGTLMEATRPNQLIGVIAHETGHIAGGHLARAQEELRNATIESIVASVLGLGAAVAAGQGDVAGVLLGGSQAMAQSRLLAYSRAQESAADQAGMTFLDATHQSARGMLEFLDTLRGQEFLLSSSQSPYLRSHPLTVDRIEAVEHHVANSRYSDAPDPPEFIEEHKRMRAKLIGFIRPLNRVLQQYPESDTSLEARYARSIAYYRRGNLKQALPMLDTLLAEHPHDPWFQELKGQILFEYGRPQEALGYYEESVRLRPREPLLRMGLGQVQLELNDPKYAQLAAGNLEETVRAEPRNSGAWRLLSIAYGRSGDLPMAALALAESAAARGDKSEARQQADRAMQQLPEGSPAWIRAQDIMNDMSGED
jgi:predicted Zn-dependent protease